MLEKQARDNEVILGKEYVSREQVKEMEKLFQTAVDGLSNRLRDMEMRHTDKDHRVS